jgi:hypothetical protein
MVASFLARSQCLNTHPLARPLWARICGGSISCARNECTMISHGSGHSAPNCGHTGRMGMESDARFYEVVAQVIPVLLLAFSVEYGTSPRALHAEPNLCSSG